jgi:hypothetical protein
MHPHKWHAAAEIRNRLSDAIRRRSLFSRRLFQSRDGIDILLG